MSVKSSVDGSAYAESFHLTHARANQIRCSDGMVFSQECRQSFDTVFSAFSIERFRKPVSIEEKSIPLVHLESAYGKMLVAENANW